MAMYGDLWVWEPKGQKEEKTNLMTSQDLGVELGLVGKGKVVQTCIHLEPFKKGTFQKGSSFYVLTVVHEQVKNNSNAQNPSKVNPAWSSVKNCQKF